MNILHILNGDSTLHGFEDTGLEGITMVWREVLSEGPLEEDISCGHFWKARAEWITRGFDDPAESYQEKMIDQLSLLSEQYDEINLWFEFDLHCQVNLLGVLNYLIKQTDLSAPGVYLICPEDYPGKDHFMGMGELTGEELEYLYDNIRVQLSAIDFAFAAEVWPVYVSQDAEKLERFLSKTEYWGNLAALKPALEAHLKRLQVNDQGLNYIEQKLLDIYNSDMHTRLEIYKAFWLTEKIYGMGDMEIDLYLSRLGQKGLISLFP
jgi:hypothetical protein